MGVIITDGKELPKIQRFEKADIQLIKDINKVFEKYGAIGKITRIEFECGTPPPPKEKSRCYKICTFGPRDEPICQWICY